MLILSVLLARMAGSEELGKFSLTKDTIMLAGAFVGAALGLTVTKLVSHNKHYNRKIVASTFRFSLFVSIFLGIILFLFSPIFSKLVFNSSQFAIYFRVGSVYLSASIVNLILSSYFTAIDKPQFAARLNIIVGVITLALGYPMLIYYDILGVIFTLSIAHLVGSVISLNGHWQELFKMQNGLASGELKNAIIKITMPTFFSGLIVYPAFWYSRYAVKESEFGFGSLGVLSAILSIQILFATIGNVLNVSLLPIYLKENKNRKVNRINFYSGLVLGVALFIPFFFVPEILGTVYGGSFINEASAATLKYILWSSVILMFNQGLSRYLVENELLWYGALSNLVWAVLFVMSTEFLIQYGIIGIGIAYVISYLGNLLFLLPRINLEAISFKKLEMFVVILLLVLGSYFCSINLTDISIYARICVSGALLGVILFFGFKNILRIK